MAGVEILAMEEVATAYAFNWLVFWMSIGICIGAGMIVGIIVSIISGDPTAFGAFFLTGIIAGMLFGTMIGTDEGIPTKQETQYKVTISDEVSMNDFLSRYEIIDQEGKIYTVREIEDGE